jgi:hypothetical protein
VPKDLQLQGLALMTAGASGIAQIACPADPGLAAWHVARLASNRACEYGFAGSGYADRRGRPGLVPGGAG